MPTVPKGAEWPAALAQLATALDTGRVYDRDLPALAQALADVADARTGVRDGDSERGEDRTRLGPLGLRPTYATTTDDRVARELVSACSAHTRGPDLEGFCSTEKAQPSRL